MIPRHCENTLRFRWAFCREKGPIQSVCPRLLMNPVEVQRELGIIPEVMEYVSVEILVPTWNEWMMGFSLLVGPGTLLVYWRSSER